MNLFQTIIIPFSGYCVVVRACFLWERAVNLSNSVSRAGESRVWAFCCVCDIVVHADVPGVEVLTFVVASLCCAKIIIGCDTGFGNLTAKKLDQAGYHVHACCLLRESCEALEEASSTGRLQTHVLDVTNQSHVDDVVKELQKSDIKLWALVNNAGMFLCIVGQALFVFSESAPVFRWYCGGYVCDRRLPRSEIAPVPGSSSMSM